MADYGCRRTTVEENLTMATARILALATLAAALPAQENQENQEKERPASKPQTPVAKTPVAKTPERFEKVATLGMKTRPPTKEECVRHALELDVRYKGQVIDRLREDGVAARAGLRRDDIILAMDKVDIFSRDDIRDLLMVRKPGQEITLQVVRGRNKKKETIRLKLGERRIPRRKEPRLTWHHAGLPYLKEALADARKKKKLVLVGLSGADT